MPFGSVQRSKCSSCMGLKGIDVDERELEHLLSLLKQLRSTRRLSLRLQTKLNRMKNALIVVIAVLAYLCSWGQERPQVVPGNLIVQIPDARLADVLSQNQFLNGQPTELKLNRLLSAPMAAYLLDFDPEIHHEQLLEQVWKHPSVSLIQLNHYISNRDTVPNDPQFGQQWWHVNTGQNNGTADADIDSEQAWDITTGGVTALGDTIVVCVVDDGGDLDHLDLRANNWVNYHEIPNNNIDDDNNGYVDDYYGWNPVDDNDNVDGGSHGVSVAGMIGAVGNNGTGVSGVNWHVKIMNMTYGNINQEANVVEAYTYPLVMRRLYEQTGGQKGAFVVATNSSWGIDNADPLDAPIWCAFYDTLGQAGILSAGATANNNVNIDVVGDLPTGCASEYMISVTATNNDDVRTFSGYGATTVDLGAPGEDVRTTSGNGGYTTTSGTSFASPATAGAIALVYAAPCASLAAIAHANPALAAQMVRDAIFDGVDPVSNLTNECVTGGRLNTKGALDIIMNSCTSGGCLPPFALSTTGVTDEEATIEWNSLSEVDSFNISYGVVNGSATVMTDLTENQITLSGLMACSDYWFTAQSICDGIAGEWADTLFFGTDGCCTPPATIDITLVTDTTARATWQPILAANAYSISFRPQGGTWSDFQLDTNSTFFIGLSPCTDYEIRVATICDLGATGYSAITSFRTFGCGSCTDLTFCQSAGSTQFEWIENVTVGDVSNNSNGSGIGYEAFEDLNIELEIGQTYDVSLSPGFSGSSYREHFRIWIDLNQDGTFSNSELLFDDDQGSQSTVTGSITIPMTAELGSARMRVSMAYGSQFGGDYPHDPCDQGQDGEVEDYCVLITQEDSVGSGISSISNAEQLIVYPVPATEILYVEFSDLRPTAIEVVDRVGRKVYETTVQEDRTTIDVTSFASGIYIIRALDASGMMVGTRRFAK
ncbi:MAG: T9SS type A sorting domain-containing protein [Bacteroidetes bacterium]|nr:MAG: T9SS type A sorting domain-containing protein [Bacteroidota bacterium]